MFGGRGGTWLCDGCLGKIELDAPPPKPLEEIGLHGFVGVGFYHDPILRRLVRELKYHSATSLLPTFKCILRRFQEFRSEPLPWSSSSQILIQPLVGSPKSVRSRGFDQSEYLADAIHASWVPWAERVSMLRRAGGLKSRQADLEPGPLREANVRGAFEVVEPETCNVERRQDSERSTIYDSRSRNALILIDDVVTTGATMAEAARLLRAHGFEQIYGVAMAVGK